MTVDDHLETFYDLYSMLLQETADIFRDPDKQRAIARAQHVDSLREMLQVDPEFLYKKREVPGGITFTLQQLRRCTPYLLTVDVARLALDIAEKAGERLLPYEPFLKVPLWIEFEGAMIGDDAIQFSSLFIRPDYHNPNTLQCDLLEPSMQRVKSLFFSPSGTWEYEQLGTCESTICETARYTVEDLPYRIREQDRCSDCICHQGGSTWTQLVRAINLLLRHRGTPLLEQINERQVAVPHAEQKLTRKQKEENSSARKKSRPNIVTISLSAPVAVSGRAPSATEETRVLIEESPREEIPVAAHFKCLVPSEGKPWKSLHIVHVESYTRKQKCVQTTRYRVTPKGPQ